VYAAGESLTPYILTSHDSPKVRERLKKHGVRFGTDFSLKHRAKPYVNAAIFAEYIRMVFIPNLNELRNLEQFADENAVLLMDNCPHHVGDVILNVLREERVRVITEPQHTTQIFQELDTSLFGVFKRKGQYKLPFDDDQPRATFLLNIDRTFKQTMVETNIWGAFQQAGFEFEIGAEPYRLQFDEEKLRSSPAFRHSGIPAVLRAFGQSFGHSGKFGHWISHWKSCRCDDKTPDLVGSINKNKSNW
jgi:hypothetical protein